MWFALIVFTALFIIGCHKISYKEEDLREDD
jgi:hypothetical protein